jgi:hypothetical protein
MIPADLELPSNFELQQKNEKHLMIKYLNSLNTIDRKAYMIGKSHLGTSFNPFRSNGFVEWKNKVKKRGITKLQACVRRFVQRRRYLKFLSFL